MVIGQCDQKTRRFEAETASDGTASIDTTAKFPVVEEGMGRLPCVASSLSGTPPRNQRGSNESRLLCARTNFTDRLAEWQSFHLRDVERISLPPSKVSCRPTNISPLDRPSTSRPLLSWVGDCLPHRSVHVAPERGCNKLQQTLLGGLVVVSR